MKNCGIVKDLLPLVAENLASEEATAFVNTHLETCGDCRAAYEELKTPVETEPAAPLKTVKRAVKKRGLLIAGLIACLVAALLIGCAARLLKPYAVHTKEAAFETVRIERAIRFAVKGNLLYAVQGDDLVLTNIEIDSETGKTYLITDDGERIALEDVAVLHPDGEEDQKTSDVLSGRLILKTNQAADVVVTVNGGEVSVSAYTTLWRSWFASGGEPVQTVIPLDGVDAVFFEPYNNTEREPLYVRDGYAPEAGYALPRLVLNYYFLLVLVGTVILAAAWLVLLLLKKQKARRALGVLLLVAGSFVLAFLAAGFPATTIAPVRELSFVLAVAVLLIGAGLCGRKLMRKD